MAKDLDLSKSVYELVQEYPELKDILYKLGFTDITKPGMLDSVGRIMSIPKGAAAKNIPMGKVVMTLMAKGYHLTGKMPDITIHFDEKKNTEETSDNSLAENTSETVDRADDTAANAAADEVKARRNLLKSYLRRLGEGEDLEAVRADFAEKFADVEAAEIMQAEQELMAEGTPLEEVQKLCDVHSALFHGATREEQIANAEKAVEESAARAAEKINTAEKMNDEKRRAAGANAANKAGKVSLKAAFAKAFGKKTDLHEDAAAGESVSADAMMTEEQKRIAAETAAMSHEDFAAKRAEKMKRGAELAKIQGHPINTFTRENEALSKLIEKANALKGDNAGNAENTEGVGNAENVGNTENVGNIGNAENAEERRKGLGELLAQIRGITIHHAKKGDLIYPNMAVRYHITGPSDVMWTVDDEIRDELGALVRTEETARDEAWEERVWAVLKRSEEMIYKEENILFPMCAENFTQEEWYGIYEDSKDYAVCLGVADKTWPEAEEAIANGALDGEKSKAQKNAGADEIVMPGGHMTVEQLTALLNILPFEVSFVDANDINSYFNEGPKEFKRPGMALGRNVYSCHPPKVEPMVRAIIEDFRAGARDKVQVWAKKGDKDMLVTYVAVRNKAGEYLGTAELCQNVNEIRDHFCNNFE